jgi:hypothetical protein
LLGNLTPRHKEVFLRNPLFVGMRLPEVREISPLEKKFTRISAHSLELMKVWRDILLEYQNMILTQFFCRLQSKTSKNYGSLKSDDILSGTKNLEVTFTCSCDFVLKFYDVKVLLTILMAMTKIKFCIFARYIL